MPELSNGIVWFDGPDGRVEFPASGPLEFTGLAPACRLPASPSAGTITDLHFEATFPLDEAGLAWLEALRCPGCDYRFLDLPPGHTWSAAAGGCTAPQWAVPIEELMLETRSYKILRAAGIRFVNQLLELTETDLHYMRNMGQKSVANVVDRLREEFGLALKPEQDPG